MPGKYHLFAIIGLGAGVTALGAAASDKILGQPGLPAGAVIKDVEGRTVGSLRVEDQGRRKSKITVTAKGLPPGYHGFHIHKKGVCDATSIDPKTGSPFFSAGPHFDLGAHPHPNHSGDLPPLLISADGTGRTTIVTERFRLRQLLDGDGSAIIIHALPDNQANVPKRYGKPDAETLRTGDSGARIACGVISKR
ncbi:superoxide dismutase family protein [Actinomadura sp. DC4]|uniref:superoxide dismutase family protein n=1 Tax=Actinomadura sp. DC4 TaxID=3055069 RepID=UPI0025B1D11B|nr:superoxide dismutase family protein [Actinomadura sp. DC4]MDN3355051.1 superoxide dismutase family protein [Actinomadura sp. DC4]